MRKCQPDIRNPAARRLPDGLRRQGATELSAKEIIARLCALDETPWRDFRSGKPITEAAFAALLEPYGITSKRETSGKDKGCKKWHGTDFEDAWRRYL